MIPSDDPVRIVAIHPQQGICVQSPVIFQPHLLAGGQQIPHGLGLTTSTVLAQIDRLGKLFRGPG